MLTSSSTRQETATDEDQEKRLERNAIHRVFTVIK